MTYGENGSVIGPQNLPTTSAAPGVWSMGDREAQRDGMADPFDGWIGQYIRYKRKRQRGDEAEQQRRSLGGLPNTSSVMPVFKDH